MKAQFATMEVLVALIFVLSALGFAARTYTSNVQNAERSSAQLLQGEALYDITAQTMDNAQMRACIANYSLSDSSCIGAYITRFSQVYKQAVAVSIGNKSTGPLTGAIGCMPYPLGNVTLELCISAGG